MTLSFPIIILSLTIFQATEAHHLFRHLSTAWCLPCSEQLCACGFFPAFRSPEIGSLNMCILGICWEKSIVSKRIIPLTLTVASCISFTNIYHGVELIFFPLISTLQKMWENPTINIRIYFTQDSPDVNICPELHYPSISLSLSLSIYMYIFFFCCWTICRYISDIRVFHHKIFHHIYLKRNNLPHNHTTANALQETEYCYNNITAQGHLG